MVKLLMKQAFWPLVGFTAILLIGFSFVAYFQQKYQMFVIPLIFFNVCLFVWSLQFYCIVCAGFVAWSVPLFYLKFKFKEVHAMIETCVKHNNMIALKNLISQHNTLSVQTRLIDDVFMFVIFILYYVASPALMLFLYLSHAKEHPLFSPTHFYFYPIVGLFRSILSESGLRSDQSFGSETAHSSVQMADRTRWKNWGQNQDNAVHRETELIWHRVSLLEFISDE